MNRILMLGCCMVLAMGCATAPRTLPQAATRTDVRASTATWQEIGPNIKPDPDVEAVIQPYREQLNAEMGRVIGHTETDLVKGGAESTLGNFVTDVLLETARKFGEVDCAITNSGGLRSPIFKGDIRIGDVFQLMPFENYVVIAEFNGPDFLALLREIAEKGGEPIAGLTIVSTGGIVTAYVGDQEVVEHRTYRVSTIDYLLKGGGRLETMSRGRLVKDTGVLLREAIIDYVEKKKTITAKIEGRMIIQ